MNTVAIQGIRGSYSEEAAVKLIDGNPDLLECKTFDEVFEKLTDGSADCAVVPIENSIVGEITPVAKLLREGRPRIQKLLALQIDHVIAGVRGARVECVQFVISHEQALKQCRNFLSRRQDLTAVRGPDTASCVRRIVEQGDKSWAAIASHRASRLYGADVLISDIADSNDNSTTFCLVRNQ